MALIHELREGIKTLKQKVVALEAKLEELERKKNEEGLSADTRKDTADEIAFIRALIPLEKQTKSGSPSIRTLRPGKVSKPIP